MKQVPFGPVRFDILQLKRKDRVTINSIEELQEELDNTLTSVSGNPITISDASNTNAEDFTVTLVPTQAGTGDPSPTNVRPISGVSTLNVYHVGKNLCPMPTFSSAFGWAVQPTNRTDIIALLNNLPSGTYTISATFKLVSRNDTSDGSIYGISFSGVTRGAIRNAWGTLGVGGTATITTTVTISETTNCTNTYFYGCGIDSVGSTGTARVTEFQIEQGSSATTYEPYQGTTLSLNLGSTVYGGSVDLSSGVLTVDKVVVDLGDLTWDYNSTYQRFTSTDITDGDFLDGGAAVSDIVSSIYPTKTYNECDYSIDYGVGAMVYEENKYIAVRNKDYSDAADFKTAMDGVQLLYKLATPTTTQLTAQQIRLLQGENELSTTGSSMSFKYQRDNLIGELKAWVLDQLS